MANKSHKDKSIANRTYQYSDYYSDDDLSKGMAKTHEQVSDAYMEGTLDQDVTENRTEESFPRKGNPNGKK
ncbi:DUF4025 domain-containing protein [Oceanobacillus piezotolerans]|uniref:DUF4025 domain-containing protein n=1 Tax=Oceanobacillus piezotolerans TaxID=2448030 RepID=A0A498DAA1_9BACI|nr:YozQ family protein [Oceanobacillus piezotolerans]RLL41738.1 DUF4025 domain-containing protein [Oceanobacillus piezotolerans]